jgi:hypothetical protein
MKEQVNYAAYHKRVQINSLKYKKMWNLIEFFASWVLENEIRPNFGSKSLPCSVGQGTACALQQ